MKTNHSPRTRSHEHVNRHEQLQGKVILELKRQRATSPEVRNAIDCNLNTINLLLNIPC